MRRAVISWSAAFALLLIAFGITVMTMDATLYSAGGFVSSYLDAVARHDADTARSLPGVLADETTGTELLSSAALGSLTRIHQTGDVTGPDGVHTVTFTFRIGGTTAEGAYRVTRAGSFLGLFPTWRFATSPLATVAVTPVHDSRFRANGVSLVSPQKAGASASYSVFTPGLYTFDHSTKYLRADAIAAPITEPGSVTAVQVNVQANAAFTAEVTAQLHDYLAACTKQQVLLPTSCPFGQSFDNRVVSTPAWTMARYPRVQIVPGSTNGSWLVPETGATAHLMVKVQSLFDGTISTYDRDVPFTVAYVITLTQNDDVYIKAQ